MQLTQQQIELNRSGPISNEMFRLAVIELRKDAKYREWDKMSPKQQRNHCIALLWNSGDIFLKRAKFNLNIPEFASFAEERRYNRAKGRK